MRNRLATFITSITYFAWVCALAACRGGGSDSASTPGELAENDDESFVRRRAEFVTAARGQGPSDRAGEDVEDPPGAARELYRRDPDLWAWVGRPHEDDDGPAPVLVYLHGDFSLAAFDFRVLEPFRAAGFITVTPVLRGENGTEGDFTLLFDELDDAVAAIRWASRQPGADPQRVYVFGHSIGGGLAALCSLVPDLPVRLTGSSGGLYVPATFERWAKLASQRDLIRFDPTKREELELRTLGPNLRSMQRRHIAYVGRDDRWFHANVSQVQASADALRAPFEHVFVEGDHKGALAPSLQAFLRRAIDDGARATENADTLPP